VGSMGFPLSAASSAMWLVFSVYLQRLAERQKSRGCTIFW
jgi:hypothetical protein